MATLGTLEIDETGKKAKILTPSNFILQLYLGDSLQTTALKIQLDEQSIEVEYKNEAHLRIELRQEEEDSIDVYKFLWKKPKDTHFLKDTIELDFVPWYGGAMLLQQAWPIDKDAYKFLPYVVYDTYLEQISGFERYWLCSKKIAVHVPSDIPLWTQIQKGYLNLQAQISDSPYSSFPPHLDNGFLEYEIWVCKDTNKSLAKFHLECSKHLLGKPNAHPDPMIIEKPIWTTWAKYGKGIRQDQVLEFAEKIRSYHFEISQLELDDKWTTEYGDYDIDRKKFPDFSGMIEELHKMGIRLTAWVHPFVNLDSNNGRDKNLHKFFVQTSNGCPGIIKWWNGKAYIIDMTNPDAMQWFKNELEGVKKHGVFAFKFDAGEVHYMPKDFRLHTGTEPNDYSRAYARFAASFGTAVEARVGSGTQELPILIRTLDRESQWSHVGMQTLIPSALNFSLHGYFWNLPDIIGGNGVNFANLEANKINALPEDKELYIRWVQLNTFLLTMQFSFCPWEFDEETVRICQDLLKLRSKWVDYIKKECETAVQNGVPVIRPLWWELETPKAYGCSDQFFVGDKLLVAPVVYQGVKTRDVFLPEGCWKEHTGKIFIGPIKTTVETSLEVLPFYEKLVND